MKTSELFSIGEASRITGMHIKSLRYYDRIGAFTPAYIDENTGYRYYSFDQLQDIIAIGICIAGGITLSDFTSYAEDGSIDYSRLISDAGANIDRKISSLEKHKTYLSFLHQEVDFNDDDAASDELRECRGSVTLWITPFDGDIDTFNRKASYLELAAGAAKNGFQIMPLYFGLFMKCSGNERQLYMMAGIKDFLSLSDEDEHIFHTPDVVYSCARVSNLDVTEAEKIWPEYFALDYDKVVFATTSLSSYSGSSYSLFINKPPRI